MFFHSVPFIMTHNNERKDVLHPGFGVQQKVSMIYSKKRSEASRSLGVFQCFEAHTLGLILLMHVWYILALWISKPYSKINTWQFLVSILIVGKAALGQSFDKQSMGPVFNRTSTIQISFLSAFGAFIFWSYTGILTSLVIVQQDQVPLKSLDELKTKSSYALFSIMGGSTQGDILQWVNNSSHKMNLYTKFIEPFGIQNTRDPTAFLEETMHSLEVGIVMEKNVFMNWVKEERLRCQFTGSLFRSIPKTAEGWMFPKNSMLQPLFDNLMKKLYERGVWHQILRKTKRKSPECPNETFSGISLEFSLVLFIILSVGISISFVVIALELLGVQSLNINKIWP